jgi:hypothetical protein
MDDGPRFSSLHSAMASEYSDTFKEVFGVRPRHYPFDRVSTAELSADLSSLYDYAAEEYDRHEAMNRHNAEEEAREAAEAAREATRAREERWMDAAAIAGAAGW